MQTALAAGPPGSLTGILEALDDAASARRVSIADLIAALGQRSFTPVILAVALLMVSPLSGIPTLPTISAVVICLVSAEALIGRDHLWLPPILLRRALSGPRLHKALHWLERPSRWADSHAHRRLALLATGPARRVAFLACFLIPLTWPLLELVPFVTTIGATVVSLIAFGLLTRDGVFVLAGYLAGLAIAGVAAWIVLTA